MRQEQIKKAWLVSMWVVVLIFSTYWVYTYLPVNENWSRYGPPSVGVDWKGAFRPACIEVLSGRTPYNIDAFFNPPWTLLPLLPIALLSPGLGSAIMYVINFASYLYVLYRLKTRIALMVVFVLFSGMLVNSNNGNIEGLIALGFILPPQAGLFFAVIKPQLGIAVVLFWLVESFREGGIKQVLKVFLPVSICYGISFLLFGLWISRSLGLTDEWWNVSIFPWGIPAGFIFLALAVWKRELKFAIAASPFFAPYLTIHSWAFVWLGLLALFPNSIRFPSWVNKLPWRRSL